MLLMELCIVYVYVILSFFATCHSQAAPNQPQASKASLMPSVCRKDANGTVLSVEIQLPFMDMVMQHEHQFHVVQERRLQLLLTLHGHELFQLQLGDRDKRLVRVGELTGRVRQQASVAAAVVSWRDYLLLAVALEEYLEVYQLPQRAVLDAAQLRFDPIQEFLLPGKLQQMHLLKASQVPEQEQVLLLLAINHTRTHSKCKTFEWLETYFNPLEDHTLPVIRTFQLFGGQPYYLLTGRYLGDQLRQVLTLYELETPSLRLKRRQSLTVKARHIRAVRFRGRNWFIACGKNATTACILFRMVEGNFLVYRKHVLNQLHFSHLAASERGQILAGARVNGEVLVFNSHRLDCYSGFVADANPSELYVHRNPLNETFLLLVYRKSAGATMLRMVQLGGANEIVLGASLEGNDDLSSVQQHRHEFEEAINALRSVLLRHQQQLDIVRQLNNSLQQQTLHTEQSLHVRKGARIDLVHLQSHHLNTPTQLKHRMEQLRLRYGIGRRTQRSFGVGNTLNASGADTLKVKHLHVQNLIYHGELLPGYSLDTLSPVAMLNIKTPVLTKTLHTKELLTPQSYQRPSRSSDPIQFGARTVVRHLQVDTINNLSWFEFYDALFLHGRDNEIDGRLIVQSRARVVNLQTPLLNGLLVQQLFNLRQPQVISSNILISAIFVTKVDAQLVNGLNFGEDIVFRDTNETLIETPVRINQMTVSGDMIVANQTKLARQMQTDWPQTQLQQYYTGKVVLNGSLRINNLLRDTNGTKFQLADGQSLHKEELHRNYLLLQQPQNLSTLAFGNAKVTTPTLDTAHIEGHPTAMHLLVGAEQAAIGNVQPMYIIFMNATLNGDVYCSNYSSQLAQLARDAVRKGETATITGQKHFEAALTTENLQTESVNGIPITDFVLKSQSVQNFSQLKYMPRILVKQNLNVERNLMAQHLNGMAMSLLMEPAYSLQRLELLDTPQLKELIFQRLNGLPFDELLGKLSVGSDQQLLLNKQLIIDGNVRFENELQLQTLNDIPWDGYVKRLVNANANSLITSRKVFKDVMLLTDALHAPSINGLNLSVLLDNTLLRATPQSISGDYTFERMSVGNLDVSDINGVSANSFMDTRRGKLQLHGDLYVNDLIINGSLSSDLANDPLPTLEAQLAALQQRNWTKLFVLGDALWPQEPADQQPNNLEYVRQHAVRRGRPGDKQTITGHIVLDHPLLDSIQTNSQVFPGSLNFSHIANDALLRHSMDTQVITGAHQMLQPVTANSINLLNDCQFGLLNNIDINRLNASMYRRSSGLPIAGILQFKQPPSIDELTLNGTLNGGKLRGIFEESEQSIWPAVRVSQLNVEQNLQLGEINGMSLEYLLQHRVPLRANSALELFGQLNFEHLQLGQRAMLRTINGISLQNVVYKHGQRMQAITGTKTFEGGIQLNGPVHIMRLNGKDLSESYQQSIFTDRDYNIDSLVLDGAVLEAGLLPDSPLVGQQRTGQEQEQQQQQLEQLEEQVNSTQMNSNKRLLYLDYEQELLKPVWMKPGSNVSFDLEAVQQPLPNDICQLEELHAQLFIAAELVYLSNVSLSNRLFRVSSHRADLHVKARNYCSRDKFKSRIYVSCRDKAHTLGVRQQLEGMQLLDQHSYSLLLLSTVDELRVLHVNHTDCRLTDWQSLQPAAGRLMQLLEMNATTQLLLSSGLHDHLPVVAVHRLDVETQRFELLQLIEGDYDLAVRQQQNLLLSCHGCRHITIHAYDNETMQFAAVQQLRLEGRIQQLMTFVVGHEAHLLVITMPGSSHFYLFSYAHIEGWQQRTYGQLGEALWFWPLVQSGAVLTETTPIMLLCGQRQCSLVRALIG